MRMHNMNLSFAICHLWLRLGRAATDAPCYRCDHQGSTSKLHASAAHFTALDPPKYGTYTAGDFG